MLWTTWWLQSCTMVPSAPIVQPDTEPPSVHPAAAAASTPVAGPGAFDPGEVYVLGTIDSTAYPIDQHFVGIAHWSALNGVTGFLPRRTETNEGSRGMLHDLDEWFLNGDGALLYTVHHYVPHSYDPPPSTTLHRFACEGCPEWRLGDSIPLAAAREDPRLDMPECDSGAPPAEMWLGPEGEFASDCHWGVVDAFGRRSSGDLLLAYGPGSYALTSSVAIDDFESGTTRPVDGVEVDAWVALPVAARIAGDRYLVVQVGEPGTVSLLEIDAPTASLVEHTVYESIPSTLWGSVMHAAVDRHRNIFLMMHDRGPVLRIPPDGGAEVLFWPPRSVQQPVPFHPIGLVTGP